MRGRQSSLAMQAQSVNLYCAECEVQIGIFENEWIRLTSSYARCKEKGTHFGIQVGERLQTVPPGAVQKSAVGCQMAEVFCRKCSNMVGQYCKSAPHEAQQEFVQQLFFKLSRTFLKDSKTNEKVDPIFAFDTIQERSSTGPRQNSVPSRWQNTPLRESSSTPATVQTAARSRGHRQQQDLEGGFGRDGTPADSVSNNAVHEANFLRSSSISHNETSRRQSSRVVDREGRMYEIEGRLRFHDGRLMDQENFLNDVSARLHEQGGVIDEQKSSFDNQEASLSQMRDQITSLQQAMDDLRSSLLLNTGRGTSSQPLLSGGLTLPEQLESLAQAFRGAQDATKEVEQLRAENQRLRSRLTAITGTSASSEEVSPSSALRSSNYLGKRKRDGQNIEQMLTPQSHRSTQQSPQQQIGQSQANSDVVRTAQEVRVPDNDVRLGDQNNQTSVSVKRTRGRPSKVSKSQQNQCAPSVPDAVQNGSSSKDFSDQELSNAASSLMDDAKSHVEVDQDASGLVDAMDMTPDEDSLLPIDDDPRTHPDQQTQFVQDPTAFDDLDFSDEEEEDMDNETTDLDQGGIDSETQAENAANPAGLRDGRSTAPEPFLKPKVPANRTRTYITLDRAHIATPWTFWAAIANGQQPKLIKPPAIQTRKKDLEDELTALGLQEWIGKDKKSKEYREAVDAARTRLRNEKRAALLASKGLKAAVAPTTSALETPDQSAVLSTIQNVRATEPNANAGLENVSGDENSQSTSASQRKEPELGPVEDHTEPTAAARTTRKRVQRASLNLQNATTTAESVVATENDKEVDQPAKRKRKPTERAKNQRHSEIGGSQTQQETSKKTRGKPRKSAPAELSVVSGQEQPHNSGQIAEPSTLDKGSSAISVPSQAADGASPTLSASKQQLLEKMRLKAQQKDQLREEMIKARDRLAEEAMAAMEMETIEA